MISKWARHRGVPLCFDIPEGGGMTSQLRYPLPRFYPLKLLKHQEQKVDQRHGLMLVSVLSAFAPEYGTRLYTACFPNGKLGPGLSYTLHRVTFFKLPKNKAPHSKGAMDSDEPLSVTLAGKKLVSNFKLSQTSGHVQYTLYYSILGIVCRGRVGNSGI